MIAEVLVEEGIVAPGGFHSPGPAPAQWVNLAHERSYVDQVFCANVPEAINRLIGFHVSESVAARARHASAGTVLAARLALEHGIATSTAGGSHHAKRAHGAGFCVFNDVGVAANVLLSTGEIGTAMAFDCDVHQGDGTAEIFRAEPRVFTVSVHSEKNFPTRKEESDLDVGLPDNVEDEAYLEAVKAALDAAFNRMRPDIVFYNAGV
ncbi:MAG: histone deacetylase, partial [Nitratireductor sp.]|nr:histone deacetylase [Nitratireductor sp.]